jgi:uncharacterized protein (TIGR02001 family)
MRSHKLQLLSFCLLFFVLFSSALSATDTSFSVDYSNRYIWRGFDLNPDNEYVIQPSLDFAFGKSPWSVNLWYSHSAKDNDLNEVDLTLNYDFATHKDMSVSAGIIHYGWYSVSNFSHNANTTFETYAIFTWEKSCLSPELSFYHDSKNGNGLYAQLAVSKEIAISDKQNIELSSSLGYNQKQWVSASGLSDFNLRLDIPFKSGTTTITPFFGLTWVLMDEVNPGVAREYWMGVNLAF